MSYHVNTYMNLQQLTLDAQGSCKHERIHKETHVDDWNGPYEVTKCDDCGDDVL